MELQEYEKGETIILGIECGHYTDPVNKTGWTVDPLTDLVGYYCWVFDKYDNLIAKYSKNDLTARGFLRTISSDGQDALGKFKIKIPHTITGASGTLTGEYSISVRTQDEVDDEPFIIASKKQPYFTLIDGPGNIFSSDMPQS